MMFKELYLRLKNPILTDDLLVEALLLNRISGPLRERSKRKGNMENHPNTIVATHNGVFHADEVLAVAIIYLAFGGSTSMKLVRSREALPIAEWRQMGAGVIVVDVGNKYDTSDPMCLYFDHHQNESVGEHAPGLPLASAGLVWRYYGYDLIVDLLIKKYKVIMAVDEMTTVLEMVDKMLVTGVDALDNGVRALEKSAFMVTSFSTLVSLYNPLTVLVDLNTVSEDDAFLRAVRSLAMPTLEKLILYCADKVMAKRELEKSLKLDEGRIVVSERYLGGAETILADDPTVMYWVYPDKNGTMCVRAIAQGSDKLYSPKKPLPAEWAGLRGEELNSVTGIHDGVFCHKGRFIAGALSQDSAILLGRMALAAP